MCSIERKAGAAEDVGTVLSKGVVWTKEDSTEGSVGGISVSLSSVCFGFEWCLEPEWLPLFCSFEGLAVCAGTITICGLNLESSVVAAPRWTTVPSSPRILCFLRCWCWYRWWMFLSCSRSEEFLLKSFPQPFAPQVYGFSFVWVLVWTFKSYFLANRFSQSAIVQQKGLSPGIRQKETIQIKLATGPVPVCSLSCRFLFAMVVKSPLQFGCEHAKNVFWWRNNKCKIEVSESHKNEWHFTDEKRTLKVGTSGMQIFEPLLPDFVLIFLALVVPLHLPPQHISCAVFPRKPVQYTWTTALKWRYLSCHRRNLAVIGGYVWAETLSCQHRVRMKAILQLLLFWMKSYINSN